MTQELKVGDYVKDILTDEVYIVKTSPYPGQFDTEKFPFAASSLKGSFSFILSVDGMNGYDHVKPRFIKVDPPKRMVKKETTLYANIYESCFPSFHKTRESALDGADFTCVAKAVPVKIEYEVEEYPCTDYYH